MSQRINGKMINFVIDSELLEGIEDIQKEVKITRSEFIRVCIKVGISSYKDSTLVFDDTTVDLTNLPKR